MEFSDQQLILAKDCAIRASQEVSDRLKENFGSIVAEQKNDGMGPVTELDLWAEVEIKKVLADFDKDIGFLGEEHGAEGSSSTFWTIDPIDGTRQFVRGIPFCATMIALVNDGQVLVSVINNFVSGEIFWAIKNKGAWLNDKRIDISKRPLAKSVADISVDMDEQGLGLLTGLVGRIATICRYGSSAYSNTAVALGKIEARIWARPKLGGIWDHAPGVLLIQEAGGVVKHADGSDYEVMRTDSFFAGTEELVNLSLELYARNR